jgi:hypothetical protein
VSQIAVEGNGTAAVALKDINADNDFEDNDNAAAGAIGDESTNINYGGSHWDTTLQTPGTVVTETPDFAMQIYNSVSGAWESIFYDVGTTANAIDLSRSIVKSSNFQLSSGLLKVDFSFVNYVK